MAQGRGVRSKGLSGLKDSGTELWTMVVDYVRQETLDPLKGLGRWVAFGVVGAVALGIGVVVLSVALLRVLQTETAGVFAGNFSWVPYLLVALVVVLVAYIAITAVTRGQERQRPAASSGPAVPAPGGGPTAPAPAPAAAGVPSTAPAPAPAPVPAPAPAPTSAPTDAVAPVSPAPKEIP